MKALSFASECIEIVGASTPRKCMGLHGVIKVASICKLSVDASKELVKETSLCLAEQALLYEEIWRSLDRSRNRV
jgi:hypothetical protein